MFETEESGKRRYMGTIVGISDLDPLRWPGSKWRCLQVIKISILNVKDFITRNFF